MKPLFVPALVVAVACTGCSALGTLPTLIGGAKAAVTAKEMSEPKGDDSDAALFARLDDDADGRLDRTEAGDNAQLAADFERVDADRDGTIDRAEFGRRR